MLLTVRRRLGSFLRMAQSLPASALQRVNTGAPNRLRVLDPVTRTPPGEDVGPRESATGRRDGCPVRLVHGAQRGSRRAFDALWARYAPTVQGILLTMFAEHEAEDLTQEVAVTAFRAVASLTKPESFPAWLCTIARNTGRDALAKRRKRAEVPLDDAGANDLMAPELGDPTAANEILAQIRELPECYRESLMLRLLLEMSGPEIAEQTGMTEGSVRVNLCRGMKLLRQRLTNWEQDDEEKYDDEP